MAEEMRLIEPPERLHGRVEGAAAHLCDVSRLREYRQHISGGLLDPAGAVEA